MSPGRRGRYETAVGAKTTWVYFSDNWFESRAFPDRDLCGWIRRRRQNSVYPAHAPVRCRPKARRKTFTSRKSSRRISMTTFGAGAKPPDFSSPFLIEWGTEPNGNWFGWNGKWNGGAKGGPSRYVAGISAHRRYAAGRAARRTCIGSGTSTGMTSRRQNGIDSRIISRAKSIVIGWASALMDQRRRTRRMAAESFEFKLRHAYPRLTALAPDKPIIVAEFGCDLHNRRLDPASRARAALQKILSGHWPAVIGFCWWNEGWQNDDHKARFRSDYSGTARL